LEFARKSIFNSKSRERDRRAAPNSREIRVLAANQARAFAFQALELLGQLPYCAQFSIGVLPSM
jgi:hypothetical protein